MNLYIENFYKNKNNISVYFLNKFNYCLLRKIGDKCLGIYLIMIYLLYLFLLFIIYNYLDFCYLKQKSRLNNSLGLEYKKSPRFIIYVLIAWSSIVSYMIYFSYKEAVIAGYDKTAIIILVVVLLIWSMPIYIKSFRIFKNSI